MNRIYSKYIILISLACFLSSPFVFSQKKLIELDKIQFSGNENISNSRLSSIIVSQESPGWLSQFLNKIIGFGQEAVYFDSTLIQSDINALSNFYYDNGYFESQFSYKYNIDTASSKASITYNIYEGKPVYFKSFSVKGIEKIHNDFKAHIKEISQIDTNDIFSKNIVDQIKVEILTYLKNKGLMLATSDLPEVIIDTIKSTADVNLNIIPGKRYVISNVRVEKSGIGKDLVDDELISGIVNVKPGEFYNFGKFQMSQTRLYRTNFFNSALVAGITADTSGNTVPLQISTDIGLLNEFSPEVIINNENNVLNLGLSFGFTRKNFFGNARKFNFVTSAASQNLIEFLSNPVISDTTIDGYGDVRVLLDQPFLFGSPIFTRLENYLTLQKRKGDYNATIIGSKLSFNFELPQKVYLSSLTTYLNYEHTKFYYKSNYLKKLITIQALDTLGTPTFTSNNSLIGLEARTIKLNDFIFPTSGYSLILVLENANLVPYFVSKIFNIDFNEPQYYKVLATSAAFIPFESNGNSTLGIKFSIGQIHTFSGDKFFVPFNQRFISGGSNSVRGWKARELVSGTTKINIESLTPETLEAYLIRGEELGGYFQLEGSFEARLRFLGNLGSAFFVDYGNTFMGPNEFKFNKLAVAVGFGFRYYSEIVPIRLDFGFNFYDPNNRENFFNKKNILGSALVFHLGIGEAF
ncbi:MAG: BamA/TamA family outer membrane protein [Bacteroidetes bacterium]|nr:BamA/TamA family outer membrane protein [Bacteroidota bacterium]